MSVRALAWFRGYDRGKIPIVLGSGLPLFSPEQTKKMKELSSKELPKGIVQTTYTCT